MLEKINNLVEKVCLTVGFLLLSLFIVVVLAKVVVRNYLHIPMMWADEVAVICFIWTVFLGAAVAVRHKMHYTVDLAPNKIKVNLSFDILAHLIVLTLIYVMIVHGYSFMLMGFSRFSTALTIPLAYTFAAIPVSGLFMLFFTVEQFVKDIKKLRSLTKKEVFEK
ncbi:TRAP transporter small permease [Pseudogracilibacillus auburnensis]|uniref:TRAP-type C4-dicarboxylate transport system permease small subunit n=1 Tax=Pseudogracilibacillus auburnensis TaxID=1494959 RepID=A0A2V3W4M8_9BACI|nr:TRAP transporter small permease [Pseudogracilibacillus auburnensis]MBO1004890.1 TRAP transporter small permease [Pseudogracilibacillus auburnensis]PXW88038.1 TRAP-type C4-dicarboxylate transport system permease small subunit [Pseudogracilibacillus auburnensis]